MDIRCTHAGVVLHAVHCNIKFRDLRSIGTVRYHGTCRHSRPEVCPGFTAQTSDRRFAQVSLRKPRIGSLPRLCSANLGSEVCSGFAGQTSDRRFAQALPRKPRIGGLPRFRGANLGSEVCPGFAAVMELCAQLYVFVLALHVGLA